MAQQLQIAVDESLSSNRASELRRLALEHVWFHAGYSHEDAVSPNGVRIMVRGEGCYLTDVEGKRYLDCASGLWLVNVGYGRREIADAIGAQAARLHYTQSPDPTEPTVTLAAKLAQLTPGTLWKSFFTSGGTDSNEAAIKIALQYQQLIGETKRQKIIGRATSYHGTSIATMSVGGSEILKKNYVDGVLLPVARLIPGPGDPTCSDCADELERAILDEGPDTVAAFIAEPISNAAGVHVPADEYWPKIRATCDKYGVVLICDEVINGFGRTGKMFAVEHWAIVPDILTVAKGLTSGYVPMGAAIAKKEIADKFEPGAAEALQHVVTFGGHAVASAAALANIDIIEREGLVQNAAEQGRYLLEGLRELVHHPSVREARGIGLMCALQLTKAEGYSGFTPSERSILGKLLMRRFAESGIHLFASDRLTFMPPLVATRSDIDLILGVTDQTLSSVERELGWWS